MYRIVYTKTSIKQIANLKSAGLSDKTKKLIDVIAKNPFQSPPSYEKLIGDLEGAYSRRINIHHRLVYQIYEDSKTIKIISMWTHYDY